MKKGNSTTMKRTLMILNVLALVVLGGLTVYLFMENRDLNDQINLTTEEKNRRLTEEISQVYDLPDEQPVVAIVTDVEEFKTTYPTFDNAETGDYLLFFRKNRLNVLYRQSEKRVVKTADVVLPVNVELIGSEDAIDAAEELLSDFGNQITITKKVDNNVTQAFVFDVDGDQAAESQSIADQLSLEIGSTLPASITPAQTTEVVIAVVASSSAPSSAPTEPDPES